MVFESLKEKLRLGTGEKENGTRRKIQRRVSFAPEDFSAVQPPKQPISDAPGPFSFANPATEPASSPTQRNLSKKPSISGGSLASRKSSIIGEPYVPKGSAIPEESSAPSTALNQKKPSTPRSSSFSKEYASAKKPSPNPASPSSPVRPNETEVDKSTVEQQQTSVSLISFLQSCSSNNTVIVMNQMRRLIAASESATLTIIVNFTLILPH